MQSSHITLGAATERLLGLVTAGEPETYGPPSGLEDHLLHHAERMTPRDDGCLVDRVGPVSVKSNQRMPTLVICCPLQGLGCPHHGPVDIGRHAS